MARKQSIRKGRDSAQLMLPLDDVMFANPPAAPPVAKFPTPPKEAPLTGQVISPPDQDTPSSRWTLGEREHALLVHQADKYEAKLYAAMKAFVVAVVIDVAVNGGVPVAQAVLQRYNLPPLNDKMLSGACGLAAIIFACAMLYFYARFRSYNRQLWFDLYLPKLPEKNWARWLAISLGSVWVIALVMMVALVLFLSARDALALLQIIAWHITPTDWVTEIKPH